MDSEIGTSVKLTGQAQSGSTLSESIKLSNRYQIECRDKNGGLKWVEEFENIVPNVGLNDLLDKYLKGSAYTASFFVGLTDSTPTTNATDTMASHAGWTELVAYTEGTRPALVLGVVSGQSVDNSASKASFSINADTQSIGGAFLTTDATKSGSTGILYSVAAFNTGDKGLDSGDTLNVTAIATAASA